MNDAQPGPPHFFTQGVWSPTSQNPGLFGWGPGGNVPGLFGWGPGGNVPGLFGWGPGGNVPILFGMGPGGNVPNLFGMGPGGNVPNLFGMGSGGNVPDLFGTSLRMKGFFSTGYIRDARDARDLVYEPTKRKGDLPKRRDLNVNGAFGEVDNQGPVQSCAAHVVTSLAEYLLRESGTEPAPQLSRLYNYKVARSILGVSGDGGATMRESIKALRRYGCPLEQNWPYELSFMEREPMVSDIEKAKRHQPWWNFHRLDHPGLSGVDLLDRIKRAIVQGKPVGFGISLPASALSVTANKPVIPNFADNEPVAGKHCLLAVGYDDEKKALHIRNSWGTLWGDQGCAWLPYDYVEGSWTTDLWTLQKLEKKYSARSLGKLADADKQASSVKKPSSRQQGRRKA